MKKLLLIILVFYSCKKNEVSDFAPLLKAPNHHANQMAFANAIHDSAQAIQTFAQYPPLPSDSVYYQTLAFNTGIATYSNSVFTITQTGNYEIEATAYRYIVNDSCDLILNINGIPVLTVWGTLFLSVSYSTHLFNGDIVRMSTSSGATVETGGTFTLKK